MSSSSSSNAINTVYNTFVPINTDYDTIDLLPGLDDQFDGNNNDFVEDYILGNPYMYKEEYIPLSIVSSFIKLPRFSHSSDFSLLFSNEPDQYALGLLFIGIFITSIFITWLIIICILKCIGPYHVGIFAGYPYKNKYYINNNNNNNSNSSGSGCCLKTLKSSNTGRITLGLSSLMIMICTILLVTNGLHELQNLSNTILYTNNDVQSIENEVMNIVTNIRVVSSKAKPIRNELIDFLNRDICPLKPGSITEEKIRTVGLDTYNALTNLNDFIEIYLNDVSNAVNETNIITSSIHDIITNKIQFTTNNPKVTIIILPYFIIPAFLLVAVCMGYYDVFNEWFYTFITWFILPVMCIMTLTAIIASGWMTFFIQGNSDFCGGSNGSGISGISGSSSTPEITIQNIMNRIYPNAAAAAAANNANVITSSSLEPNGAFSGSSVNNALNATTGTSPNDNFAYDVILFYANQCDATKSGFDNPWLFLENHYDDLAKGKAVLGEFLRSIEDTTLQQLSQECGQEYAPIVELLKQLQTHIDVLSKTSIRALNLMSCQNIVPLYTNAVYDATCTYSIVGATWVFACSVCIAFFGCLCIMFRGAYYPLGYYYYDSGNGNGDGDEKSLYGTSEDNDDDDESATARGGPESGRNSAGFGGGSGRLGRSRGDQDDDDFDDEDDDLRLETFDTDGGDGSCIEAIASTAMMDAVDVDVYDDGAVVNNNNGGGGGNNGGNGNNDHDNGNDTDTDQDTLGTEEPLLDKLACMFTR